MKNKSISRRNVLSSRVSGNGNLNEWGWQIFRKQWTTQETRSIVQSINGCIVKEKFDSSKIWMGIDDCLTNRVYPANYFPSKKYEDLRLKTTSVLNRLGLNPNFDKNNINPIISDSGTLSEKKHNSTSSKDCYAVIHAVTKRMFRVWNKIGDLNDFQIEKGDILILEGNIQFS
tara:strand:- start:1 stop:519 length:519 start_codon:yes stop_codon:yes gene_type:complete